jgi:DNA helicase-2/ATP-dependent DNA helicase PcrA
MGKNREARKNGSMEDILEGLNESQRAAVSHIDGPMLTLAGPGSGKTRVVTHRIAHLLQQGVSPFSIIALTFTNKAAQEMKKRLERLTDDSSVWMGTFHGYCARFLRHYGRLVGINENFSIYDADDSKSAIEQSVLDSGVSLTHLKIGDIIRGIGKLKNSAITPDMIEEPGRSALDHAIHKVYAAYQKQLITNNAVDFDDLLMHTATILRTNEDLRADLDAKHRYILVDEYQDTNLAQYLIVRGLSLNYPNINVTGDPDQSIYGWRGADISNILNFERDYPGVKIVRLEENYRSTPEILSVADTLIENNRRRKAKRLLPTRESGSKVSLRTYLDARQEAETIADQIASAVLEERANARDFAILYRTNNQSRLLEQALLKRKLNYQLIGGFRFYHRQEIRDLLAYLRLVNNPTDDISFKRIINVPPRGLGEKTLAQVNELARNREIPMLVALRAAIDRGMLSRKAQTGAKQFLDLYDKLVTQSSDSIVAMLQTLLEETKYIEYLAGKKSEAPDESIEGNVQELISDAAEVDLINEDGSALQQFLEQVSLSSDTDSLTSDDRVTLMTLHSAKGLEFAHVYIIAIEQDILPHARSRHHNDQLEEERRLFFVGITRAKETLHLSNAMTRGFGNNQMAAPSPFLMELPRAEMILADGSGSYASDDGLDESWGDSWGDGSESDIPQPLQRKNKRARETSWKSFPKMHSGSEIIAAATLAGVPVDDFEAGMRVRHPAYGQGTILSTEGFGPKRMVRIDFDQGDRKSFQLSKSPLELA